MNEYKTIDKEAVGELTEKKSRFIATLRPVRTEEEAIAFINEMKKKYWDARHNCSAYIIGEDKPLERCSDDGEPSRTAGMPMLEILKGAGLCNICMVVTRYFGGILLGTGGLVRAYQGAAQAAVANARILTCRNLNEVEFTVDYTAYGKLQYYINKDELNVKGTDFGADVSVTLLLSDEEYETLSANITEATSGLCIIDNHGKVWALV